MNYRPTQTPTIDELYGIISRIKELNEQYKHIKNNSNERTYFVFNYNGNKRSFAGEKENNLLLKYYSDIVEKEIGGLAKLLQDKYNFDIDSLLRYESHK